MPKQIIIAEQNRIAAVFADDQIQELVVATGSQQVGDIYLGVVENVLPGIDAAFVNIGDPERNGFIHVTDLGPLRLKRSAAPITELLLPQQKVLVQVMKEPTGNKGPRLTGNVTLPGRYLVLMPCGRRIFLSQRIRTENERHRLRALGVLIKPPGMGLLIRTEAEGVSDEAVIEDLEALKRQWETIQREATAIRPPALLNRDDDFVQRVLRDFYSSQVNRIVADSAESLRRIKQQLVAWNGGKPPQGVLVDHHREPTPILDYFRVNAAIREALKPRVDLPKGGYIVIEPTEALTVIDVNSGSFTRSATSRETVLWTNYEAATEIARQLRLRNIGGVIVVDFIDMESRKDQLQVLEHFSKALKSDKARPQIIHLSDLGLVELTRKRQGQNIYELFGRPCPTCGGLGHLVQLPGQVQPMDVESRTPVPMGFADLRTEGEPGLSPELEAEGSYPGGGAGGPADRGNNRRRRRNLDRGNVRPRREGGPSLPPLDLEETAPEPKTSAVPRLPTPPQENGSAAIKELEPRHKPVKPAPQPAPVVTVGMSPLEQVVYAQMGLSPLLLASPEARQLQDAVVQVCLPEEMPAPVPLELPAAPPVATLEIQPAPPEPPAAVALPASLPANAMVVAGTPLTPLSPPQPLLVSRGDTDQGGASADLASPLDPEESSAPDRRRRRRRSGGSTPAED